MGLPSLGGGVGPSGEPLTALPVLDDLSSLDPGLGAVPPPGGVCGEPGFVGAGPPSSGWSGSLSEGSLSEGSSPTVDSVVTDGDLGSWWVWSSSAGS